MKKLSVILILVAASVALSLPGSAQVLIARLDASQEIGGSNSPGRGFGKVVIASDGLSATYKLTFRNMFQPGTTLPDLVRAAHIHKAPAGANGGVVFGIFSSSSGVDATGPVTISGIWDGQGFLDNKAALLAGETYFNVHTVAYAGGAIRGQITPLGVPEPGACALFVTGLLPLAGWVVRSRKRR